MWCNPLARGAVGACPQRRQGRPDRVLMGRGLPTREVEMLVGRRRWRASFGRRRPPGSIVSAHVGLAGTIAALPAILAAAASAAQREPPDGRRRMIHRRNRGARSTRLSTPVRRPASVLACLGLLSALTGCIGTGGPTVTGAGKPTSPAASSASSTGRSSAAATPSATTPAGGERLRPRRRREAARAPPARPRRWSTCPTPSPTPCRSSTPAPTRSSPATPPATSPSTSCPAGT